MGSTEKNLSNSLEIKILYGLKAIPVAEIFFIEADGKHSNIYFKNLKKIGAYHPIKWFSNTLHSPYFFRCHYSYIVNCRYIDFYSRKEITLMDGIIIPLSRNHIKPFGENFESFASESIATNHRLRVAGYNPQPADGKPRVNLRSRNRKPGQ